jgi:hypothetical protein
VAYDSGASHGGNNNDLSDEEGTPTTTVKVGAAEGINNNGNSGHSCCITLQQAMKKLVFIVEALNVNKYFNVTARSKMKQESDTREEPLSGGHV